MATIGPISLTAAWTAVYDGNVHGAFSGGIQAIDNGDVCVRVTDTQIAPTNMGGFSLPSGSGIYPIAIGATQTLWARASDGAGKVVLG